MRPGMIRKADQRGPATRHRWDTRTLDDEMKAACGGSISGSGVAKKGGGVLPTLALRNHGPYGNGLQTVLQGNEILTYPVRNDTATKPKSRNGMHGSKNGVSRLVRAPSDSGVTKEGYLHLSATRSPLLPPAPAWAGPLALQGHRDPGTATGRPAGFPGNSVSRETPIPPGHQTVT